MLTAIQNLLFYGFLSLLFIACDQKSDTKNSEQSTKNSSTNVSGNKSTAGQQSFPALVVVYNKDLSRNTVQSCPSGYQFDDKGYGSVLISHTKSSMTLGSGILCQLKDASRASLNPPSATTKVGIPDQINLYGQKACPAPYLAKGSWGDGDEQGVSCVTAAYSQISDSMETATPTGSTAN